MDRRITDNSGHACPAGGFGLTAESGTGAAISETSGSITVIPGEDYTFLFDGDVLLGFDNPAVLTNVRWVIPAGKPATVRIPLDAGTTLYYSKVA